MPSSSCYSAWGNLLPVTPARGRRRAELRQATLAPTHDVTLDTRPCGQRRLEWTMGGHGGRRWRAVAGGGGRS